MNHALLHEDGQRLHSLAQVLKSNGMPQETINMVLAAKCGMPMLKVDGKSMYYRWTEDAEPVELSTGATSVNESTEERFRRLRAKALSAVVGLRTEESLAVLTSVMNEVAAPTRCGVKTVVHPLVSDEDDCKK